MKTILFVVAMFLTLPTQAQMSSRKFSENAKLCSQVIPKAFKLKNLTKEEQEFLIDYMEDDCVRTAAERSRRVQLKK